MSEDEKSGSGLRDAIGKAGAEATRGLAKVAVAGAASLAFEPSGVADALIPVGAAFSIAFFEAAIRGDTAKAQEAIRAEQMRDIADVAPKLQENFKKLKDGGHSVSDGDVAGVFAHWSRAWLAADPKLRRVLKHAFAAGFDPELYEEGMVTDVFRVLEEGNLTYGDLRLLAMAVRDENTRADQLTESGGLSTDCAKCDREVWEYHVAKLAAARLAIDMAGSGETVSTSGGGHLLIRRVKPTRLGRKVAQLLSEAELAVNLGELKSVDQ